MAWGRSARRGKDAKASRRRLKRMVAIPVVVTLTAGAAWAYWSVGSVPGGNGASAATTVNQGATPTAVATGSTVVVSWAATTTTSGAAVTGYIIKRYDAATLTPQTVLTACTGTVTATTCTESGVPTGQWVYSVTPALGTYWRGAESPKSTAVTVDASPPTNSLALSLASGTAALSGNTVYYKGSSAGSFTLTNAVSDVGTGPASSATPALTGTTTGWTHTGSTVSTPVGGPYVSTAFSWAAGTSSAPTEVVTGRDIAGNTTGTTLSFVNDITAPTTGTIAYTDGYQAGRSVSIAFTTGTDGGSGIATRQLQRATAVLTGGTCGSYSAFINVGPAGPTSPYVDSQVTNGACYKYQYVVTDLLGNASTTTSTNAAKIDYAGAVGATTGLLSWWRLGESAATLSSSDSFTGTTGTPLTSHTGELGATWANLAGGSTANSEKISSIDDAYKSGSGYTTDYVTTTPASANYSVSADIYYRGTLANDAAGVVGRLNTSTSQFYEATWETDNTWKISKWSAGTPTVLATTAVQSDLVVGESYRVQLAMSGTTSPVTLKMYVNGALILTTADSSSPYTAAGHGGIIDGNSTSGSTTDTTGLHLDNFQVALSTYPRALDSKAANTGDYQNGPTLGVPGALGGDTNTAAQFDGVHDYVQAVATAGFPVGSSARSVEMWFKTTDSGQQVLFDYGSQANTQEFGLWLSGGTSMYAWQFGPGNDKTFSLPYAVNDGTWHQVVETYGAGTITLYLDGLLVSSAAATVATVMDAYGFQIGAIVNTGDINSGGFFAGSLDEVSLYTTALSAATVANHYAFSDTIGPAGGSVDASGLVGTGSRYSTSTTLSLNLAKGTDPSGVSATGNQLLRATATLTSPGGVADGACGTFGPYVSVPGGSDPVSPMADTVADQACYSYQYVVSDVFGNSTTYTSPNIKVDTTAPAAPSLAFSGFANTYWAGSGSTLYYRSGAATGSFTTTATASDLVSGIASYGFPALGANWSSTAGSLGVNTYSWTGVPAAPSAPSVTTINNASSVSAGSVMTFTTDNTPPTTGSVTYLNGTQSATAVSVSFTTGTDAGSGVGTRLLQRASAALTGTTCGTFGSFSTVVNGTNPTSPLTDAVARGTCYKYQYVVSDNVGNQGTAATSANVVKISASYSDTVVATAGLVDYWRLGEATTSSDSFTGTTGTTLQAHTGEVGATWTKNTTVSNADAVITSAGRIRKNGATSLALYYTSAVPASADYTVSADIYDASNVAQDEVAVVGRLDPAIGFGTFYAATYDQGVGAWEIDSVVNGAATSLATSAPQALVPGTTYRLSLDMTGTNIRVLVDGVQRLSVISSTITAAGRAGIAMGDGVTNVTVTDSTGMHLDNFNVSPPLADTFGAVVGDYFGGPKLGLTGAIANDSNTAAQFDGLNDFGTVANPVSGDFSLEFWFKSTQGIGTGSQWWNGAGLVDGSVAGSANDFGVSLRSDGKVMAGDGTSGGSDVSILSTTGGYNNGAWHYVVFTRVRTTGAMVLYVDGVLAGSATGSTAALTSSSAITFGRIASGSNYLAGTLDEIAVYNAALSQATVTAHYSAGQ